MFYKSLLADMHSQLAEDNSSTVGELTARADKITERHQRVEHTIAAMEDDTIVAGTTTRLQKDQRKG